MARLRGRGYIPKDEVEQKDDSTAKAIQGINFATQTALNIVEGVNKANEAKLLEKGYLDSSKYKVTQTSTDATGNLTSTEIPIFERGGSGKVGARPINRVRVTKFGEQHFKNLAGETTGSSYNYELSKFMKDKGAADDDIVEILNRNLKPEQDPYTVESMNAEFNSTAENIKNAVNPEDKIISEINSNNQNLNMDQVQYDAMASNDLGFDSGVKTMEFTPDPNSEISQAFGEAFPEAFPEIDPALAKNMANPPMTGELLDPSMAATNELGQTINTVTGEVIGEGVATGLEGQIVDATGQMVTEELAQQGLETGIEQGIQKGIEQTVVEETGKKIVEKTAEQAITDASLQAGVEATATAGASTGASVAMAAIPIVGWTMFAINMLNTAKELKEAKELEEEMEFNQSLT